MFIAGFPAGPWGTNCYVVSTGPGNECVVVDPGNADLLVERTAAAIRSVA